MWREMVRRQAQSSLTVRAFCEKHMLDEGAFFAWRRRLGALDDKHPHGLGSVVPVKTAARAPAFAEVKLEEALAVGDAAVEIVVTGGERVRVKPGFDRATLAAVLDVLEGRPC